MEEIVASTSRSFKISKFNPFNKKQAAPEEKTRLIDKNEEQQQAERKQKEMVMKYRKMTDEQADKYIEEKMNGDRLNTDRGLRALGWGLAPIRI